MPVLGVFDRAYLDADRLARRGRFEGLVDIARRGAQAHHRVTFGHLQVELLEVQIGFFFGGSVQPVLVTPQFVEPGQDLLVGRLLFQGSAPTLLLVATAHAGRGRQRG